MTVSERRTRPGRFGKLATLAAAAVALGAVALPLSPAQAQVYLGWDFGNGFGVGIGTPPSAYSACPNYGFGPSCGYYHPGWR
jgi:hypothetical protein